MTRIASRRWTQALAGGLRLSLGMCLLLVGACGGGGYGGGSMNTMAMATSPPVITKEPQSISVSAGKPAAFSVAATGNAPLSYQWLRDSVAIAGATMASYTIAMTSKSDTGASFAVEISNAYGNKTSSPALLTVM